MTDFLLQKLLIERILQSPQQRITFADYMDWVLYHPQHGYYTTQAVHLGAKGDFFTSPHLGADFGELLAEQFLEMWQILDKPVPFTLVEMGPGQGILAHDILQYLSQTHPDFLSAVEYILVERSVALQTEQRRQLQDLLDQGVRIRWCTLEEMAIAAVTGCYFSNELVDALPVHQVVLTEGQLREVFITVQPDAQNEASFVEIVGELSTPKLAEYFALVGINFPSEAYPEGYRTEINLAALDWVSSVAIGLQRGYVLTIDYGYPATRYYSPNRSQGTLQCYYRHTHHSNPYVNVGQQDMTAHVDFTALEEWGDRCGLYRVGFTQQGLFLMALGLGDRIAALSNIQLSTRGETVQTLLRRRDALHALIDPMGLGNFGVLLQSKGLTATEKAHPLKGFSFPHLDGC